MPVHVIVEFGTLVTS